MPKFRHGDAQVTFRRKDGRKFTKTYHSHSAAARAIRGWRNSGGPNPKIGAYSEHSPATHRRKQERRNRRKSYRVRRAKMMFM